MRSDVIGEIEREFGVKWNNSNVTPDLDDIPLPFLYSHYLNEAGEIFDRKGIVVNKRILSLIPYLVLDRDINTDMDEMISPNEIWTIVSIIEDSDVTLEMYESTLWKASQCQVGDS